MDDLGYIYVYAINRDKNIYKIGSTKCPKLRLMSYKTSYFCIENTPIKYEQIYKILDPGDIKVDGTYAASCYDIDDKLKKDAEGRGEYFLNLYTQSYNDIIYNQCGTEIYKFDNINEDIFYPLEKWFTNWHIHFTKIELGEIDEYKISQKEQMKIMCNEQIRSLKIESEIDIEKNKANNIIPKPYQSDVLNSIHNFYDNNNIGKLIWSCGLGKTIMSLLIVKTMNYKNILIGVPSKFLQNQFAEEIKKIFNNVNTVFINGDNKYKKSELINNSNTINFIIVTYHSCGLFLSEEFKTFFDFKIGDEAHHLSSIYKLNNDRKSFLDFHKIKSKKTLFMTATEKIIYKENSYSMDDIKIFGNTIDNKSVKWAIENKMITDYNILVIENNQQMITDIKYKMEFSNIENDEIFMSCYITLKSMEIYNNLTHILIYLNSIENCNLATKYIDLIINSNMINIDKKLLYNNSLHSRSAKNISDEINKFKNNKYGIISCVLIFGEGFDLPKLNGICIAETMTSEIRIIQSLLRPNRLEKNNPNKKSFIIIPYIYDNVINMNFEKKPPTKLLQVIRHIKLYDDNIIQCGKIKCLTIHSGKNNRIIKNNSIDDNVESNKDRYKLTECLIELEKIKIRLVNLCNTYSEEDILHKEYNLIKTINKEFKFTNLSEYNNINKSINKHPYYILDPKKYFNKIWSCWVDFLQLSNDNSNDEYQYDLEMIKTENLTNSKIIECSVVDKKDNIITKNERQYKPILQKIWHSMDINIIKDKTDFNLYPGKKIDKGYCWDSTLKFSFQGKDANNTFKEIINMIELSKLDIYIKIKLQDKKNIIIYNSRSYKEFRP